MNANELQVRQPFAAATIALIAANVLVFICELFFNRLGHAQEMFQYALVPTQFVNAFSSVEPGQIAFSIVSVFASMFLHASLGHLAGNMLFLFLAGCALEQRLGRGLFLAVYFGAGCAAFLPHVLSRTTSTLPVIGAGGAIAGVLAAYTWLCLTNKLNHATTTNHKIIVGSFSAFWLVGQFWGAYDVAHGGFSNIAYWTEVGGFLTGIALIVVVTMSMARARAIQPAPQAV